MQNVILMMGPPGSGKGTQSQLLVDKFGFGYFSMGEYFRKVALTNPAIKAIIDTGVIVPDESTESIFRQGVELQTVGKPGLVIDGFPRTLGQIEMLDRFLADVGNPNTKYIFIEVDKNKLLQRLALRSRNSGRADDQAPEILVRRFDEYTIKTQPVKDKLDAEKKLIYIDGDQTIDDVHQEILNKLQLQTN